MRYTLARTRTRQLAHNDRAANAQRAARAINARTLDDHRVAQVRHQDALVKALLDSTQWRSELTQ